MEYTLGDILATALERKNMSSAKIASFISAARNTGRTDRDVMEMLTDNERELVFGHYVNHYHVAPPAIAFEKKYIHLTSPFGNLPSWQDKKINCIKQVREITGCGLAEAKYFCEATAPLHVSNEAYQRLIGMFWGQSTYR